MKKTWPARIKHTIAECRDFLDEKGIGSVNRGQLSRFYHFAHFWLLVIKSFNRNRCPLRAASLAYTTLLALIPVLAIALSVSSAILKTDGEQRINHYIDKFLGSFVPPSASESTNQQTEIAFIEAVTNLAIVPGPVTNALAGADAPKTVGRQELVHSINGFVQSLRSGSFGVLGGVIFLVIAISMLRSIEGTFNDIWGVSRGRTLIVQIREFSAVLFLGPVLLSAALALAGGWHPHFAKDLHSHVVTGVLYKTLPILLLCVAFAGFYRLMPNTKVHLRAAAIGGLVGGILWHLNNYFSVYYAKRWISNSQIYGGLALIPVFMAGLYFSWLIVLFGAQVAYVFQNRAAYFSEKQTENINQRGREFVALRLMQCIGGRFQSGVRPATVPEMAEALVVPTRLVQQIMQTLLASGLVIEVVVEAEGRESGYSAARPLERITCHDVLTALRSGQGHDLTTGDDPARIEVFGEYEKILDAERRAASSVTVLELANRAKPPVALPAADAQT